MSTTPDRTQCRWFGRTAHPHTMEIRPLFRGSAGRWLDGEVDDVASHEQQVSFPPGTPFEVVEVVEHRADNGSPRTLVRLSELSRAAAALREGASLPTPRAVPSGPLYHYTVGVALSRIVDDGEIGVGVPPPGVETPVAWLSTRDDWEPSAAESELDRGGREPSPGELARRRRGLFRIAVDPDLPLLSFSQWVRWAEVPADVAEVLERRSRERGADPDQWVCCPFSIGRERWRSVELLHPEHGWVPVAR